FGAGDTAFDEEEIPFGVDANDLVRAGGGALVAHLPGHAHALEDTCRVGGADGARLAHVHGAVRLRAAAELVALDQALEAFALAGACYVDEFAGLENVGGQVGAGFDAVVVADLHDMAVWLEVGLLVLAALGCG